MRSSYQTFEMVPSSQETRVPKRWMVYGGLSALGMFVSAFAVVANRGVEVGTQHVGVLSTVDTAMTVSTGACGRGSLENYRPMDASPFPEMLAPPGCPVRVEVTPRGSRPEWSLRRIWTGTGMVPSAIERSPSVLTPSASGETATVTLWTPGLYEVAARFDGRGVARRFRCLYVRREIRSLSREERDAYLSALTTLATTPTDEGRARYGGEFVSLVDLGVRHFVGSAQKMTDRLHEGQGFLSQHIALTNEFEKALQVVDARVSVPYWDFTRDAVVPPAHDDAETTANEPVMVRANPELWREPEGFFALKDGAAITTLDPRVAGLAATDVPTNAFGYMRAPWNLNPDADLARYFLVAGSEIDIPSTWPTCRVHSEFVSRPQTLGDFIYLSQIDPHGQAHNLPGGIDAGPANPRVADFVEQTPGVSSTFFKAMLQAMWRVNAVVAPESCDLDPAADAEICRFECPRPPTDLDYWNRAFFENPVAKVLDKGFSAGLDPSSRVALADLVCSTNWRHGEAAEAASTRDPSFWTIHPTLERLWQYKLLLDPDLIDERHWIGTNYTYHGVNCIYEGLTPESSCLGHHPDDPTFFATKIFSRETGGFNSHTLTVRQVLESSDPRKYRMDYIYDTFTWPHCEVNSFAEPPVLAPVERDPVIRVGARVVEPRMSGCDALGVHFSAALECAERGTPVLGGVDVVAYQSLRWSQAATDRASPVRGQAEFSVVVEAGFVFYFANAANRDTFLANPEQFAPRLGGFATLAVTGANPDFYNPGFDPGDFNVTGLPRIPVDPAAWYLDSDGNLFLFENQSSLERFFYIFPDVNVGLTAATANWKEWTESAPCRSTILFNTDCLSDTADAQT